MLNTLQPYIISFAIGLLIGIERERSHPVGMQAMGVRTFILFALLGTLGAEVQQLVLTAVLSLFVFGAILLSYFRTSERKRTPSGIGITTELSAALVYCLGYVAVQKASLAMILGLAVLIVLLGRKSLHSFARQKLQAKEIQAAVAILIIALGVLSFLPNRTIDPWGIFNPQRFGVIVMLLSVIQFCGYLAIRIFGQRFGLLFLGFFGGMVSSTAVYATLPTFSRKHPKLYRPAVAAAIFAQIGTLIELLLILLFVTPLIVEKILWPIMAIIFVGVFSLLLVMKHQPPSDYEAVRTNPLDFRSVIRLSLFIGGMLILVALAKRFLGVEALQLIALIGGLFELHSVSLANATLFSQHKLLLNEATVNISFAILATFLSKFFLLWTLGRNRFALITTLFLFAMLLAGGSVFYFTVFQ